MWLRFFFTQMINNFRICLIFSSLIDKIKAFVRKVTGWINVTLINNEVYSILYIDSCFNIKWYNNSANLFADLQSASKPNLLKRLYLNRPYLYLSRLFEWVGDRRYCVIFSQRIIVSILPGWRSQYSWWTLLYYGHFTSDILLVTFLQNVS